MTFEESFELEHLFLNERKCRSCGKTKNLLNDFYLTRKDRALYHLHILMNVKSVL